MAKVDITTYGGLLPVAGYAGQIVDGNPTTVESKQNDQATSIDFGVAVARSAADNTCKAPTLDADKIIGISARLATKVADSSGNVLYLQNDMVPIVKEGYVYVVAYENVVRGDGAISVTAQNGKISGTTAGAAGAGRVAIPAATWETTTAAGSVGIVRIAQ